MSKEYWWISVGGNSCEPAVIVDEKQVFTCGCPDPFDVKDVLLVKTLEAAPDTPAEAAKKREDWERKYLPTARGGERIHGYRRFE